MIERVTTLIFFFHYISTKGCAVRTQKECLNETQAIVFLSEPMVWL